MKKITILTSLLALTACGGGGHGGSGAPAVPFDLNTSLLNGVDAMSFQDNEGATVKFKVENGNVVSVSEISEDGEELVWNRTNGNKFQLNNYYLYDTNIDTNAVRAYLNSHGVAYDNRITQEVGSATQLSSADAVFDVLIERNLTLLQKSGVSLPDNIRDILGEALVHGAGGDVQYEESRINNATLDINSVGKDLQLAYSDFGSELFNFNYTGVCGWL